MQFVQQGMDSTWTLSCMLSCAPGWLTLQCVITTNGALITSIGVF